MPFSAVEFADLWSFSPRHRESQAFTPTPVPTPTAIIRFCQGNARDTAVRASSLRLATKIESTTLYSACTSMETIMGTDMETSSRFTGWTPILFSFKSFAPFFPGQKKEPSGFLSLSFYTSVRDWRTGFRANVPGFTVVAACSRMQGSGRSLPEG